MPKAKSTRDAEQERLVKARRAAAAKLGAASRAADLWLNEKPQRVTEYERHIRRGERVGVNRGAARKMAKEALTRARRVEGLLRQYERIQSWESYAAADRAAVVIRDLREMAKLAHYVANIRV